MTAISSIKNYILYLKEQCGLYITLHPLKYDNLICPSELISFNIHDNPYCVYMKTCPEAQLHCVEKQEKVAARDDMPYTGICYAGVRERIYPIRENGTKIGFISVSGYCCKNSASYLSRVASKYDLDSEKLRTTYLALKQEEPNEKLLDTLLYPLVAMLELAYSNGITGEESEKMLFTEIIQYIRRYHNEDLTVQRLCDEFGYSRSYISHNFKKIMGMSLKNYINTLRVDDAKKLLRYSNLNIMEIAVTLGFHDSNYFSGVFKGMVGVSPMGYKTKKTGSANKNVT